MVLDVLVIIEWGIAMVLDVLVIIKWGRAMVLDVLVIINCTLSGIEQWF